MRKNPRKPTLPKIRDFIRRRNTSEFQTNFQFQADLDCAGIDAEELPTAVKVEEGVYEWALPEIGILHEERGKLSLRPLA